TIYAKLRGLTEQFSCSIAPPRGGRRPVENEIGITVSDADNADRRMNLETDGHRLTPNRSIAAVVFQNFCVRHEVVPDRKGAVGQKPDEIGLVGCFDMATDAGDSLPVSF